ncbi:MAG: helicase C-terminal domain-containing protein [Candidatus Pacearchaeota archaeon]
MTWSLYEKEKFLEPLKFSNGKTQEDVVVEVLKEIENGSKVIFIHGVCGTGKSAIALNIAKKIGKTSIVVPGKNLQAQYKKDYESEKYLLKDSGEKLKISVITGRNNHRCKFLEDKEIIIPKFKREVNSKLNDIFEFTKEELEQRRKEDLSADRYDLPCKIEIKEKNSNKIREYLKNNKKVNPSNIGTMKDVRRISIASVCPYWSPVIPKKYELKNFEAEKRIYDGLGEQKFIFYQRMPGCKFYEQFNSYLDSDVIVFNSLKYKLESGMERKPLTEVEIIDECDEFLDSFSNQRTINIDRLQNSLNQIWSNEEFVEKVAAELNIIIKNIHHDKKIEAAIYSNMILPLKETKVYDLLKTFLDNEEFLDDIDDESYLFDVAETARMFNEYLNETFLTFSKRDNNLHVSLVTTNLEKKFKELIDKNKIIVLMSGTLHSGEVLRKIFGLNDYKIIEAETIHPGHIEVVRTGLEMDCKYDNFCNGKNSREKYLEALNKCLEIAKKPILVHVNSFADLPSEKELQELKINRIITMEKLKEIQREDKTGKVVERFKKGEIDILFSTRASRGMDFPGTQCNSIIFTKYPNPNVKDAFWKILKQTRPEHYWNFYKDKAKRELLQKVYRGLRFKEDHIYLLSPDERVLKVFEKI